MERKKPDPALVVHLEPKIRWDELKKDSAGLIPCVIQDARNGQVLMVGWTDRGGFEETLRTGVVTYWSRSRGERWLKGETSGHFQYVRSVTADCDLDTLLIQVEQVGAACHTGRRSCFFNSVQGDVPFAGEGEKPGDDL
ncbi:MAG: phosphoribosyl-AMP cyclohydrolase [Lachnospiraceae bacterium]|jgi:phosphoribosyl-ATP pyrophosphohydrolase/phosphoribosyl-AMP cyclohydrolase